MNTELVRPAKLSREEPNFIDRLARRIIFSNLERIEEGQIVLTEAGEHYVFGEAGEDQSLSAHITVLSPEFYSEIAFGGTIGSGEAFIQNYWRCDDLTALIRIMLRNRDMLGQVQGGLTHLVKPARRALHWLNRNTRKGSRRNISAHYDLGNDFYSLWLDPRMMYSCAFYEQADTSLKEASTAKLERICQRLELSADDSVIEIGTGWGGFAIYAAQNYGCRVTTTTISREQFDYAQAAVRAAGLEDRITLLLEDYRDLEGQYDKLVSIEMIEAVGHKFHENFFRKCASLLKRDGLMLLQAITITDQRYESYKRGVDFIQRYIFPGGCLTSVTDMAGIMTQSTDMRIINLEDIGPHYAKTLRDWHDRFFDEIDRVRELGYTNEFIRMWQFYLCFCEAGFFEREIGTVQMLMMRPDARAKAWV